MLQNARVPLIVCVWVGLASIGLVKYFCGFKVEMCFIMQGEYYTV